MGDWAMGRIYEQRGGPERRRRFCRWTGIFGKPAEMRTDGHAATLDEAKAQFEAAWGQWLAWAKLQEKIAAGAPAIGKHDSLEHPGGVCVFGGCCTAPRNG